jgi:hypothetical protein
MLIPWLFRPLVTVTDDGEVCCLKHMKNLGGQNIFAHFLKDPNAFTEFLHAPWDEAYSSMFVFVFSRFIIHCRAL